MLDIYNMREHWVSLHDTLTGLPSDAIFYDRLQQSLLVGRRESLRVVLALVGVDPVDTRGEVDVEHRKLALVEIADRLVGILRSSDTAGRLDVDHFAIVLPHTREEGIEIVATRVVEELLRPITIGDADVSVRVSIGMAVAGNTASTLVEPTELFGQARDALREAREDGGGFRVATGEANRDLADALGG